MRPVIASQRQSSATFADKEQIWADDAASSRFFGNVYVCFTQFRGSGAAPLVVTRSTDGGNTWEQKQVTSASNVAPRHWGQSGCTIRTDSNGVVYVFYEEFQDPAVFLPPVGTHFMVKSLDGGRSWEKPQPLFPVTDPCYFVDPVMGRCVMDGIAGARNDLAAAPSVDIANGAPTGSGATNLIVDTWADGRDGQNFEDVMYSYSTDGNNWSSPARISSAPTAVSMRRRPSRGWAGRVRRLQRVHDAIPKQHRPCRAVGRCREARERGRRCARSVRGDPPQRAWRPREALHEMASSASSWVTTSTRSQRMTTRPRSGTTSASPPTARRSTPGGLRSGRCAHRDAEPEHRLPADVREQRHLRRVLADPTP
jgi:hypothetical protein